jgi:hypothetical protein
MLLRYFLVKRFVKKLLFLKSLTSFIFYYIVSFPNRPIIKSVVDLDYHLSL